MKTSMACLIFSILLWRPITGFAQNVPSEGQKQKRVLILLGYTDEGPALFSSSPHLNDLATFLASEIRQSLTQQSLIEMQTGEFETADHFFHASFVNINMICPGESSVSKNVRRHACQAQKDYSLKIKTYLEGGGLKNYDEFIYIGHSRGGYGLGLGPYISDYLESFYAMLPEPDVKGRLKKIVMASCSSDREYGDLKRKYAVEFVGNAEATTWKSDLDLVISEIKNFMGSRGVKPLP